MVEAYSQCLTDLLFQGHPGSIILHSRISF
jgi:hypothetical protein